MPLKLWKICTHRCSLRTRGINGLSTLSLMLFMFLDYTNTMIGQKISAGVAHKLPKDLRMALSADMQALAAWESLTPLARNEWICWIVTVKQQKTRDDHIVRTINELNKGLRRPCCWMGCVHRTDKATSPSVKHLLSKRSV